MLDPIQIAQAVVCLFFAGCFLQSGLDKVFDWKGNLEWLTGHFAKTPLRSMVPLALGMITLLEIAAGLVSAVGIVAVFTQPTTLVPTIAMGLSSVTLAMLFIGQRVAKDYPGAASLATYFGVSLLGLALMAVPRAV